MHKRTKQLIPIRKEKTAKSITRKMCVDAARQKVQKAGEVEINDNAKVRVGDGEFWVCCWVMVSAAEAEMWR